MGDLTYKGGSPDPIFDTEHTNFTDKRSHNIDMMIMKRRKHLLTLFEIYI